HAGGWSGQDLSRGIEQRPAAQVLSAHPCRPRGTRRAEVRMERLRRRGGQRAVGRQAGRDIQQSRRSGQMTKAEFLDTLRRRLSGLPAEEIDDLVGDYDTHFAEGMAAGRSEAEIAAALGDPMRLARELRAEAGF